MKTPRTPELVLHVDDLGMSRGANAAFAELLDLGTVTCGSVMVPCPWFADLAAFARARPEADVGVHLTLTSEMRGYRWRPLTRPPASAGLTDGDGFFHADVPTLRARAHPEAVEAELRAQVEAALGAGIDVTHLDDHMGAVLAPEFAAIYVRIAVDFRLPPVFSASLAAYGGQHNMTGIGAAAFASGVGAARRAGFRIFDRIVETDWRSVPENAAATWRGLVAAEEAGTTFFALHPTKPGDIEEIDPDFCRIRTGEWELFRSAGLAGWLAGRNVSLVGMRALREAWRRTQREGERAWSVSASA